MNKKQEHMKQWVLDNYGNNVDKYYEIIADRAISCHNSKGNRNGHNDKSFIGPERMKHLFKNRNDVLSTVHDYCSERYPLYPSDSDKLKNKWMSKFDWDVTFSVYRFENSNRSPKVAEEYQNNIKKSPGNNGRARIGDMICILFYMKAYMNRSSFPDIDFSNPSVNNCIKIGSTLLGTNTKHFRHKSNNKRVVNLNNQHTVKKLRVNNKVIH